ncbi:MAG: 1-(5-phosphoribosyl)-5-[Eggerthellaceae bacterium]|nr:1-(5-phosphoribosyl)-5-[(5-phosphoribosylamino)methylideneamino]imidazole-4-carboxamide isomerase [Eggerthellaceae bacterium]
MYLLPAIDILEGRAVRLAKGDYAQVTIYNDDPVEQAKIFEDAGAEWIHMVDLDGAKTGEPVNIRVIERILSATKLNIEIGGGIRTMETCRQLIEAGAARLVLGTALVRDPEFAMEAIAKYGDALAAGIDAKGGEVAVSGWREGSGVRATELALDMSDMGYQHLVYTDISRDGMHTGLDRAAYEHMAAAFGHPVIASGGVASMRDIELLASVASNIEGIITGRAIYEGTLPLQEAIEACKKA